MKKLIILSIIAQLFFLSCKTETHTSDAYGNFEATETTVSSEANGKILRLDVKEGQKLKAGTLVGIIDTTQLQLKKEQAYASISAIKAKRQTARPQIEVLQREKAVVMKEKQRVEALLKDNAATPKMLDDINGKIEVIDQRIIAAEKQVSTANRGIMAQIRPLEANIKQINDGIKRCYIHNPIDGTVLLKLAEQYEMTGVGRPLYKIVNMDEMTLRVFVTGAQLPHIKIGQTVSVLIDENEEQNRTLNGIISWIADEAEFTPKIIQTKEERVNLVYAVKIKVKNDGTLKIGMPAEVNF